VYCRANDLRCKDVVNIKNGCRIGYVSDFEIDLSCARISALIIYGRWRLFGLLGRGKDIVIRWCDIQLIGEDTILVNFDAPSERARRQRTRSAF
jgi:YlmC/YmxH family sporulation protein